MILRRYGTRYHSVEVAFNPSALTEIGFRRDHRFSISLDELVDSYDELRIDELVVETDGEVQSEVENALLAQLQEALMERLAAIGPDEILVVMNERDDWPKTRERRETVLGDLENRPHFHWWVEPPLRVRTYRRRAG